MATEDEIAGVYEGFMESSSGVDIVTQLLKLVSMRYELCDYELTQLISMVQNMDYTGEHDTRFEDARKSVVDNDSCG